MDGNTSGIIFDIKKFAIHDGPGIRTTVFLKGCPLKCWWCHNPESQSFEIEKIKVNSTTEKDSEAIQKEIGKKISVIEVMDEILKDRIFYDESGGGITFSGGEPLSQSKFLLSLLLKCKEEEIHTVLDTSGFIKPDILFEIAKHVNLFLYDLKFIDDSKHVKYIGVSNNIILGNLKMLVELKKNIIIRIPIIPTINDTDEEILNFLDYLSKLNYIEKIDLLPFHKIGKDKYDQLNMTYKMEDIQEPSKSHMEELKVKFESFGFDVSIGG